MPQFVMPFADSGDQMAFNQLDIFTRGYVEAIFWLECNEDHDEEGLADMTFADLSSEALDAIKSECAAFQASNAADLDQAGDAHRNGVDFWLTRNGHGAGFWDRDYGPVGDRLSDAAQAYGNLDVYRGDDGKLYFA